MLYHNGPVAVRPVGQEPKQEKYKSKPSMGELNALANYPEAVTPKNVQVSQSLVILWKKWE